MIVPVRPKNNKKEERKNQEERVRKMLERVRDGYIAEHCKESDSFFFHCHIPATIPQQHHRTIVVIINQETLPNPQSKEMDKDHRS